MKTADACIDTGDTMSDGESRHREPELSATDTPSGGGIGEDWLATLAGLGLLLLALLGLIPDGVLW
mgnify:CR=1 FL=1|jgi:hypothetical protein